MKRILIACEKNDEVRSRFEAAGFDAWSCDLQPSMNVDAKHYKRDVMEVIEYGWDAMIAFPPCTHLAVSGSRHFAQKIKDGRQKQGIDFFMAMVNAPINRICIENPVGIMSRIYKKPTQIVEPYHFGNSATKKTCLWLKNLPPLFHNSITDLFATEVTHVDPGEVVIFNGGKKMSKWYADTANLPYAQRSNARSKTFPGIAEAMVNQWSTII